MVPLGDVATVERKSVSADDIGGDAWYLGLEHIESGGRILGRQSAREAQLKSSKFRFGPNHLLYGKLRPYLAKIALPDFEGVCSTDILPVRPGPNLDRTFLAHYLRKSDVVDAANLRASGANLPRLSPVELEKLPVPLPSLDEQRRIAAILDQADAIRTKRRDALARLETIVRNRFIEVFGNPVLNPYGLPTVSLLDIGALGRGVSKHRPRNDPALLGGPYPLIQTGDVANSGGRISSWTATYSELGLRQSKIWPSGTLCITIAANIAKTGILDFDACFPDSVVGFQSSRENVHFVQCWMSFLQPILESQAPQSAQRNINLATLRALQIPIGSLDALHDFAAFCENVEEQRSKLFAAADEDDALCASLQFRAFKGEL